MLRIIVNNSHPTSLCTTALDDKNEYSGPHGLPFLTISLWGLSNHHGQAALEFLP